MAHWPTLHIHKDSNPTYAGRRRLKYSAISEKHLVCGFRIEGEESVIKYSNQFSFSRSTTSSRTLEFELLSIKTGNRATMEKEKVF